MDIRALSQLAGGATASASAVAVPIDTRALLSEVAASTTLSDGQKGALIAAVATVDSGLSGVVRNSALEQIQRLGIYLRNSGSEGFPRWPMMTALRSYGMNLTTNNGTSGNGQSAVISNLKGQLEEIAQGRGVTLERAIAAAVALPIRNAAHQVEVERDIDLTPDRPLVETIA